MNALRFLKALAFVVFAMASHTAASAVPVTYWFSGVVDEFANASNAAPAGVTVGTPFVGRISYDPTDVWYAYTNSTDDGGVQSQYEYTNAATFTFTLYIGGHTITNTALPGRSGLIGLENNVSERDYYYADTSSALTMNGTNLVAAPNQSSMTLSLLDPNSTALNSTGLPLAAPVLSQFGEGGYLVLSARNANGTKELFYIGGPVSELRTNEIVQLEFRLINSSTAQLAWPLYANGYTLQATTNIASPNWQNVGTPVVNTATERTVSVSTAGPQRFYRLKK
jgi:hypothetical protein